MALGHVFGGGTSINAMVWMRGMERDYDGWAKNGPWVGPSPTCFRFSNVRRIGRAAPTHSAEPAAPHPPAEDPPPARRLLDARQMGMPILDDVNGPSARRWLHQHEHRRGWDSVSAGVLRPALSRPNLTLLLNSDVVKPNFRGTRCGVCRMKDGASGTSRPTRRFQPLAPSIVRSF